ncbi:MAG: PTS fructose transporter subunit IIC [Acidobacteriota bacterium]
MLQQHKQYLLTGVSYVVPFIACGGILIASAIAFAPMTAAGPDFSHSPVLELVVDIGSAAFALAMPVLAGFIAHGIAGRPGLVPGMIGGFIANQPFAVTVGGQTQGVKAGFLGALLAGLLAGHLVNLVKKAPIPKFARPVMPIIVIPALTGVMIGVVMFKFVGEPVASLMASLSRGLDTMGQGNAVLLAAVLGAMIAFDMGGPVNKAAFFFGAAMIQNNPPNYTIMGCTAAAICTPPLGLALATLVHRKLWTEEQRESGIAALGMGMIGITEGAIPFAAADPVRVIPSIMLGSMVAAVIAMLGAVGDHAPHGGPIVLPAVVNRMPYVVAIVAGTVVTALTINLLKLLTENNRDAKDQRG